MSQDMLIRSMQAKLESKVRQGEIDSLEYWREHLEKLIASKPDGVASLQVQIRKIADMMVNRVKVLKKEQYENRE
ncbi:MAG: hypothetical protein WCJ49_01900 [Deltaproteobacteria bacterium]